MRRKEIAPKGGPGSRLNPLILGGSKHLPTVYGKPMIHYPLSAVILARIREILIVSIPQYMPVFRQVPGDGSQWGIELAYAEQTESRGRADALLVGRKFADDDPVPLIYADNIADESGFPRMLAEADRRPNGAPTFGTRSVLPNDMESPRRVAL